MTNYHLTPPQTLPSLAVREVREKRKQVLAAVRKRRKRIYHHFRERKREQYKHDGYDFTGCHTMGSKESHQQQDVPIPTEHQVPSLMEAALTYAHNGWPVFPLHGKMPYKDFHWREEATSDPTRIEICVEITPTQILVLQLGNHPVSLSLTWTHEMAAMSA